MRTRFTITVSPAQTLRSCAEKLAEESEGLYGWHNYSACPNCVKIPEGFEFWGENGHMQAKAHDREQLIQMLKYRAKTGQFRFRRGSLITYRG